MDIVRTPESRFENLADFPFVPNYAEVDDGQGGSLRVHYVDEGQGDADPVTRGGEQRFIETVPGAAGQQHTLIRGAGHFLQDDAPEALSTAVIDFIRANPVAGTG